MIKKILCIIFAAVFAVSLFSCGETDSASKKLSVVATCFPPYDLARAVAGDTADIKMLLQTGSEAHSYEPTPLDISAVQRCDVFICIGGEDEVWVDRVLDSIDTSGITVVRLMDHVEPVAEEELPGHDDHEHEHEHDSNDAYGGYDDHIWTSPVNNELCLRAVEAALCEKLPENKPLYTAAADKYAAELEALDRDYREMTENAPENVIIVGDRYPFRYLSHEYGLEYFAAFSGCSSESEPSVRTMALLMDEIKEHGTDVVFCLEFSTKKLAEKLCDATGAHMLTLHSCHNVSEEDFANGVTYIDLMRENLSDLREALY